MALHPTTSGRLDFRYFITIAGIAAVYFGASQFGFLLAFATSQVTAVWPPTGIAFAAYVLFGPRVWPGVYLGAFLANAGTNETLGTAAGIAVGNTLAGVAGLFLLNRFGGFDKSLERLRDVLGLAGFAAAIGCAVSATNGVANLAVGGVIPWSRFGSVWPVWWVGDALGVLLVAPFLLTWITQPRVRWNGWRLAELGALFVALAAVCEIAFSAEAVRAGAYAVFPVIIWAALRFGQRETASASILISAAAIWGTIHDRGPFAIGSQDERLILLDLFMAVASITALTLGAVTAERKRAELDLRQARDQLEVRVKERTAELAATNRELAKKNEEVEAFVYIVSHDLRAPLVNLQGFSKELETSCQELETTLQAATLPAAVEKSVQSILKEGISGALHYIRASTTKFQRLIDALLMLSREGRQEYRSEEVEIRSLVGTTLDSLRQSIEKSAVTVSVDSLPNARGDVTAVGQVFSNLVGNALKYLQPGRPGRIEIGGEAGNGMAHYWIRDNGAGIPVGAQRRLFQVFQRFHPELAPGEGMGLAIVKRVVERHGGKVWADSQEGIGTTFHVTLPAADSRKE